MQEVFELNRGSLPLLVSFPHNGSWIPDEVQERMTEAGRQSADTDWFLDRLYDFPEIENATRVVAKVSRYVIDFNRPRDNQNLYPGQKTPQLCPTYRFDQSPIYLPDAEPDEAEIERRVHTFWRPYHETLRAELDRLVAEFGFAVLLDAHSIASRVPRLFEGRLPDFNFGTNHGKSCQPEFQSRIEQFARSLEPDTHVVNGRFIGGYITRHYGQPEQNVDAIQLELSQATYLDETGKAWDDGRVATVRPKLRSFIQMLITWIKQQSMIGKRS